MGDRNVHKPLPEDFETFSPIIYLQAVALKVTASKTNEPVVDGSAPCGC